MKKVFLILLILRGVSTSGQTMNIDSIQAHLIATENISQKLYLLQEYSQKLNFEDNTYALKYARQALDIAQKQTNPVQLYAALLNIAEIYKVYAEYEEALRFLSKALQIAEKQTDKQLIIPVLNQLARIHLEMSHIKEAFDYSHRALELAEAQKDIKSLIEIYNDLGSFHLQNQDYNRAKSYTYQAFRLSKKLRNRYFFALSNLHLATIYNETGEFKKALLYATATTQIISNETNLSMISLKASIEMGRAFLGNAAFENAQKKLHEALDYAHQIKARQMIVQIYKYLSLVQEYQNNPADALHYYKLHKAYTDSVFNEDKNRSLSRMHSLLQLEKKNKEIDLLTKDKKIREEEYYVQTLLRNSLIGAFAFFLILAFVLYRNNAQTQKINRLLRQQNLEINRQKEAILEHQKHIEKKNKMLELQNFEINLQNEEIENQNKDIRDSIEYAQRIQAAMLPSQEKIVKALPEHFILFKPRDIVSGDFYWFQDRGDIVILGAIDCTGHGVPGAFMSLIANDLLNEIIIEKNIIEPDYILKELHHKIMFALNQEETKNRDGMDIAMCVIHKDKKILEFAGAYNPMVYIQNQEINMIKGDSFPIGGWHFMDGERIFTRHQIDISQPTVVYIYSDGFQDQFGGPDGRKLMKSHFRKLLQEIHTLPMSKQKDILNRTINNWMRGHEQVDDMLIIGVKLDF
ncbi:MAG: tetratricopeptide repeat protein [Microscillaceae bacterium]|nr:tetratricopeptide repeat protein [Microscillaceae bacterium]